MSEVIERIKESIEAFSIIWAKNPYNYLYESDIQAGLYSELYCKFKGLSTELLDTKEGKFNDHLSNLSSLDGFDEKISTSLLKTEYPSSKRFDIAILKQDQSDVKENIWNLIVEYAIEIKYAQAKSDYKNYVSYEDYGKLVDYDKFVKTYFKKMNDPFYGKCITFVQPDGKKGTMIQKEEIIGDPIKYESINEIDFNNIDEGLLITSNGEYPIYYPIKFEGGWKFK